MTNFLLDSATQNLDLDCNADSANLLAKTEYYRFTLVTQSIRATNHNRSNGGVALDYFCMKPAKIELMVH